MKAPVTNSTTTSLADFWGDGPATSEREQKDEKCKSTELLNWISNVTIKRRSFRRRSRCTNLRAEALLSNTLRQARQELAVKQEEKRRKAVEFSCKISVQFSQVDHQLSYFEEESSSDSSTVSLMSYEGIDDFVESNQEKNSDPHVEACISSLDNFFSELKQIKA